MASTPFTVGAENAEVPGGTVGAVAATSLLEMESSSYRALTWFAVVVLCLQLTACELAKGIFKAGVWVGVLGVVAVLALAGWGLSRLR